MTIRTKNLPTEVTIDLDGPDGNAFSLLAIAERYCRMLDLPREGIIEEMKSGDYANLVQVFDREFGSFVVLETSNPEIYK